MHHAVIVWCSVLQFKSSPEDDRVSGKDVSSEVVWVSYCEFQVSYHALSLQTDLPLGNVFKSAPPLKLSPLSEGLCFLCTPDSPTVLRQDWGALCHFLCSCLISIFNFSRIYDMSPKRI